MAKRWYTKEAVYVLPRGQTYAIDIDAIHIDADLFENNIPVKDCVLWITAQPWYSHMIAHWIDLGVPSFQGGKVIRLSKRFNWLPYQTHAQSDKIFYNGNPYGMGLNTIAAEMYLEVFPLTRDVVYDVSYIMEVDV